MDPDQLWRKFPDSLLDLEERFPNEDACRAYLIELRWGDLPRCGRCDSTRTWELENGRFECQVCGHQTSLTARLLFLAAGSAPIIRNQIVTQPINA